MFSRLFGRKKQDVPPQTPVNETLQKLRETEEVLLKKQEYLEKKMDLEMLTVKKNVSTNKRVAMQALKRRKQYEKQLQQLDGVLNTLQHQKDSLENASVNAEVLQVLGASAKAMKAAHNNMDVDQIHDLVEDIAEQQEMANEVAQAISNPVGLRVDDEDDLLAELETLEAEHLDEQLLNVGAGSKLPSVPTAKPMSAKAREEDELQAQLANLQAWAES